MFPRDDSSISQAIPWLLAVPTAGVSITGGPLQQAFEGNLAYLGYRDPQDMLYWFGALEGAQNH